MRILQDIPAEMRKESITWAYGFFKNVISKDFFYELIMEETNWKISLIILDDEDKIKGLYLLGNTQLSSYINNNKYNNLKGVEGILLAVDNDIRGLGWGNKLKDYPKNLGFDYIWGQQLKSLNNLTDWLKRRELVGETKEIYITAEIFSK